MTYSRAVNNETTEQALFVFLVNKDYQGLMRAIDKDYRLQFSTEESGEAFEDCIDWCAQNAGGLEPARQLLLELFKTFYSQLPEPVRDNLAYLAEEIGYSHPNVVQLTHLSTENDASYQEILQCVGQTGSRLHGRDPRTTAAPSFCSLPRACRSVRHSSAADI
jgi:hypothetical protein